MDVAAMNVRIMFQKNTAETDAVGNHKNVWADYFSCRATVSGEAGKQTSEAEMAGTVVDESDISFTVRWCKKASVIDSTGYRVLFDGGVYDILAADHVNYKKKCLKFKCRKVRR